LRYCFQLLRERFCPYLSNALDTEEFITVIEGNHLFGTLNVLIIRIEIKNNDSGECRIIYNEWEMVDIERKSGMVSKTCFYLYKVRFFPLLGRRSGTETTISDDTSGLLYQTRMMMHDDECGTVGGMIGREARSSRKKPAPVSLCPPQIPHNLTRVRSRAAAVRSQPLVV
jgi:hypothetical protein